MARARYIKPDFFMSDDVAACDPLARLMLMGMWTIADADGRMKDEPKRIKALTIPFDDCEPRELLNQLETNGLIERYESCGIKVISIPGFRKDQRIGKTEGRSVLPGPHDSEETYKRRRARYVYFVESPITNSVKIGIAHDPEQRTRDLQVGSPVPLKLMWAIEGGKSLERELHERFADDRIDGEWFTLTAEIREFIEGLKG